MTSPSRTRAPRSSVLPLLFLVAACAPEQEPSVPPAANTAPAEPVATAARTQRDAWSGGGAPRGTTTLRGIEERLASTLVGRERPEFDFPRTPQGVLDSYRSSVAYGGGDPVTDLSADLASLERRIERLLDRVADRRRMLGRVRPDSPGALGIEDELAGLERRIEGQRAEAELLRDALALAR